MGGKLRLLQRIGRGGMGEVWLARNEATGAEVAVKTLHASGRESVLEERFRQEARLAATISHRHVVRIFDLVDEPDGTLGLVMELLRGGTLEATLEDRVPMSPAAALAVTLPVLSALQHVHERGIVHRDVKPGNIFFAVEPDGHVIPKILDFGIAKLPQSSRALTVDGSVLGTPHYMSPEQIRANEDIDGRSDMFSMAVVLYEMLTAERLFQRDRAAASLAAVLEHEADPHPKIEPRLWFAIARALGKRPYERYASCAEFADALQRAAGFGEEAMRSALFELRPRADILPDTQTHFEVPMMAPSSSVRGRTVLWTSVAATSAAAVAVAATLVLTGQTSTTRRTAPAPLAAAPASPPAAATAAAPPPSTSVLSPAPSSVAVSVASATRVPPKSARPAISAPAGGAAVKPPAAKRVATTPDF